MSTAIKLSKAAEEDLNNLAGYTLRKWGLKQSRVYKQELQNCLITLAISPYVGRDASEFFPDLLRYPFKAHTIFYKVLGDGIFVVRVLSQRRNFHDLFRKNK